MLLMYSMILLYAMILSYVDVLDGIGLTSVFLDADLCDADVHLVDLVLLLVLDVPGSP